MIEIDGIRLPESQVISIRERTPRRFDKDGQRGGYDTRWTVEPKDGPPITTPYAPRWLQTIPNTTPVRILVVTDLGDDEPPLARFMVADRPVIGWRLDALAEGYDAYANADPLLADTLARNQCWCLFDPTTGQAWDPDGFSADTRAEAIEIMKKELIERAIERAHQAKQEAAA